MTLILPCPICDERFFRVDSDGVSCLCCFCSDKVGCGVLFFFPLKCPVFQTTKRVYFRFAESSAISSLRKVSLTCSRGEQTSKPDMSCGSWMCWQSWIASRGSCDERKWERPSGQNADNEQIRIIRV